MGILRVLYALTVVFEHTPMGFVCVGGRNAVQLFYIISGFLILIDQDWLSFSWIVVTGSVVFAYCLNRWIADNIEDYRARLKNNNSVLEGEQLEHKYLYTI